jgi:hypothetical protein
MRLDEFIKETLLQIAKGDAEAIKPGRHLDTPHTQFLVAYTTEKKEFDFLPHSCKFCGKDNN